MYEHLRNDFMLALSTHFTGSNLDLIMNTLDRVATDYTVTDRETQLAVIEDDIPKIAHLYLASKKLEGVSDATIKLYSLRLRQFFNAVGRLPQDIETNEIRLFLAQYKMQRGISDRSLDKFRQILNGFFEWCVNEDYMTKNPCKNIKEIKYEVTPRKSLDREQLELVRRACETKRDLAIVDVLYSTGCRVSELVNMTFSDIYENAVSIVGKGKKHNTVYLNAVAKLSLDDYVKERNDDSDYLFVSNYRPHNRLSTRAVEQMFREIAEKVNIKVTPHIIRHTTATLSLQSGMEITTVQKMLGHSSVNTTQIYAETSQQDVANAHRKYVV